MEPRKVSSHIPAGWVALVRDDDASTDGKDVFKEVPEKQIKTFSLHHDKSAARVSAPQTLLSVLIDDGIDIETHLPVLWKTAQVMSDCPAVVFVAN